MYNRFLRSHPLVAKRIPQLKDVKISDLSTNEKVKTYGATIVKVLDGLIEHIDDPEWRKEHAKEANLKQYIVPKIPARLQLTVNINSDPFCSSNNNLIISIHICNYPGIRRDFGGCYR